MSIVTGLKNTFTAAKTVVKNMTPAERVAKSVALVGSGAVMYDIHHEGKEVSLENRINRDAEEGLKYFKNTRFLDSKSAVAEHVKNALFEAELKDTLFGTISSVTGYIKGAFEGITNKLTPIGLTAATLLLKGTKSVVAGSLLVGYGLYKFVQVGFGHLGGKYNEHKL